MFHMLRCLFIVILLPMISAVPTPKMCASFAKFAERWNPLPETLLSWSKANCDKIQPRPNDMSCDDIVQFVADCNYGASGSNDGLLQGSSNRALANTYYQRTYGNSPRVLGKYIHYNAQTAYDYGQYGNWYYPNYYPPTYLGYYDGRRESIAQLENDYKFARGGHYPYNRADNIVNIGLQQTYLPTCLHDLFYCVRAQSPSPYTNYYQQQQTTPVKRKHHHHHHRHHDSNSDEDEDRRKS